MNDMIVCIAETTHILPAKHLADSNRAVFGFVPRAAFEDAFREQSLLVALVKKQVAGFVRYHHRQRDARTTLYDICVEESLRRQGIGSSMIRHLKEECARHERTMIGLKCPVGAHANAFYAGQGFLLVATLPGKRRAINEWHYILTREGRA